MKYAEAISRPTVAGASRKRRGRRRFRRGVALVWSALMLIVMIGIVGLSIDWGWMALDVHGLQNAADAAALSGAMNLKMAYHQGNTDTVFTAARSLAVANYAAGAPVDVHYNALTNDPTLDVVFGRWFPSARTFEAFEPANPRGPNAVKVVTRHLEGWPVNQPLPLHFGPIFGKDTANVTSQAVAMTFGGGGAGLICLAKDGVGLELQGNSKVAVYGVNGEVGEIYVNSIWSSELGNDYAVEPGNATWPVVDEMILEDPALLVEASNWAIYCDQLNVCGEANPLVVDAYDGGGIYPVISNAPEMPDPLAWLPDLSQPADGYAVQVDPTTGDPVLDTNGDYIPVAGPNVDAVITSADVDAGDAGVTIIDGVPTLTLAPGYYSGGFRLTSAGAYKVRLLPGVYAVGGSNPASGLVVSGGVFEALGCMLYVTQSKTGQWGQVNLNGSESNGAQITISEYEGGSGQPAAYQPYADAGMAVFQDRDNEEDAVFTGGSASTFAGTLYFHNDNTFNTLVSLGGNSGNLGIQVVTDRLLVHGTKSMVTIMYDGRNFEPSDRVCLVK